MVRPRKCPVVASPVHQPARPLGSWCSLPSSRCRRHVSQSRTIKPHSLHPKRSSRPHAVSNAPLATIDIATLKPSRFLMEGAFLPYRDHEGRINLHLCEASEKELTASSRADIPVVVQDTLKAWVRHARAWALKDCPTWTREESAQGGAAVWVSSAGERLREGGPVGKVTKAPRAGTESISRVASRVAASSRCFIALHRQGGG